MTDLNVGGIFSMLGLMLLKILFKRQYLSPTESVHLPLVVHKLWTTTVKISQETFKRYDPVEIEIKTIPILDYNVTYRRGINNDTDFYIEKGPRISVLFLHGPGEHNLNCT